MSSSTNGTSSSNGHGGSRPGAGRKPKALRYSDTAALVEEKIAAALPDITDALIEYLATLSMFTPPKEGAQRAV